MTPASSPLRRTGARRARRAAAIGTAGSLLSACVQQSGPVPITTGEIRRAATAGETLVVARFRPLVNVAATPAEEPAMGGKPAALPRAGSAGADHPRATAWRIEDGRPADIGGSSPSEAGGVEGWIAQPLPPGSYFMQFLPAYGFPGQPGQGFTFAVPPGGGVTYIGSFGGNCGGPGSAPCDPRAAPVADPPAARPPLPAFPGPQRTALAAPFSIAEAQRGWPAPARIEPGTDRTAWQAAINWEDFASRAGSRGTFGVAGGIASVGMQAGASGGPYGALFALPFFAGALGVAALGGVVAGAEAIHRGQVQRDWRPCLEGLAAQAAPEALERHLAGTVTPPPPPAPSGRRGAAPPVAMWQVRLTRVVLRQCREAGHYGVEVGTLWSAPGREARFVRPVAQATPSPSLTWSQPAPWEGAAGGEADCRPLADYCRPENASLVAQEVMAATTAARDLLLQSR